MAVGQYPGVEVEDALALAVSIELYAPGEVCRLV